MPAIGRPALIIAHPGHELRVLEWLRRAHPRVHILTDGSGRGPTSRIDASIGVIEAEGASVGEVCAPLRDVDAYRALMAGDAGPFIDIAARLVDALRRDGATFVAGDAFEGYNPVHDVCRVIIEAAVTVLRREGRTVESFDFPLTGRPDAMTDVQRAGAVVVALDETQLAHKLQVARAYTQLEGEVSMALAETDAQAFAVECLRPVSAIPTLQAPPFYERHGERRVAEGHYAEVLRYRAHFVPVGRAIDAWARGDGACAS